LVLEGKGPYVLFALKMNNQIYLKQLVP